MEVTTKNENKLKPRITAQISEEAGISAKKFRDFLAEIFLAKQKINSNYSIRSFARYLKIHHATLSPLLAGKRPFTKKTIQKLGQRLGLSQLEIDHFCKKENNNILNDLQPTAQSDYHMMNEEHLQVLQEWYHDAIIELIKTKAFKPDLIWIAQKLSISVVEVRESVDRLFRLGYLKKDDKGNWLNSWSHCSSLPTESNTSKALREYQKTLLKKSQEALELVPVEERFNTSLMVAIDPKDLDNVRELIKKFRRELNQYLTRETANQQNVYAILFAGFPVTDPNQE